MTESYYKQKQVRHTKMHVKRWVICVCCFSRSSNDLVMTLVVKTLGVMSLVPIILINNFDERFRLILQRKYVEKIQ